MRKDEMGEDSKVTSSKEKVPPKVSRSIPMSSPANPFLFPWNFDSFFLITAVNSLQETVCERMLEMRGDA